MSLALAFALTPREPTPSHPAQRYALRAQDLVALARLTLDHNETLAPDPDPIRDQAALAACLLYTSPSPRDRTRSRMPSSA